MNDFKQDCKNCGVEIDELDDSCPECGHSEIVKREFDAERFKSLVKANKEITSSMPSSKKFIAESYREMLVGEDNKLLLATLKNSQLGVRLFAIPMESQLAKRIQYFVINGNKNYLEDGLMQDRLVILEDFKEFNVNIDGKQEKVLTHKTLI